MTTKDIEELKDYIRNRLNIRLSSYDSDLLEDAIRFGGSRAEMDLKTLSSNLRNAGQSNAADWVNYYLKK